MESDGETNSREEREEVEEDLGEPTGGGPREGYGLGEGDIGSFWGEWEGDLCGGEGVGCGDDAGEGEDCDDGECCKGDGE